MCAPPHGALPLPRPRPAGGPLLAVTGERFEFPARASSVPLARDLVCRRLARWEVSGTVHETAQLLISELVTNAVLHTHSERIVCRIVRPDETRAALRSGAGARAGMLRIEVADQGPGPDAAARPPGADGAGPEEEHGRGLRLLDALADAWGVICPDQNAGCTVWAELAP